MTNEELDAHTLRHDEQAGQRMLREVYDFLGRFVAYPSEHARVAHALWIVHAHMMDRWDITPRIAFLSAEPQSGKSRALDVTKLLVPRPMQTVNMSPAALFRCVQSEGGAPTLLFERSIPFSVPRQRKTRIFAACLMLATNGAQRRIAACCAAMVLRSWKALRLIAPWRSLALAGCGHDPFQIGDRANAKASPGGAGGELPKASCLERCWPYSGGNRDVGRFAAVRNPVARVARPNSGSRCGHLGAAYLDRGRHRGRLDCTRSLCRCCACYGSHGHGGQPRHSASGRYSNGVWRYGADVVQTHLGQTLRSGKIPLGRLRGKPLDERGLARRLLQYYVKSKTIRLGLGTIKGYQRADFLDVWPRYIPKPPGKCVTSVTGDTDCNHCHKPGAAVMASVVMASVDGIDAPLHRECMDAWAAKRGGALAQSQVRG